MPEEQGVTLECELSKPDQKVKWFKNGKEIKPDRKRGIVPKVEGTKHTLTIPKSLSEDTAEYAVKLGDKETKGNLTVEGRRVPFCQDLDTSLLHWVFAGDKRLVLFFDARFSLAIAGSVFLLSTSS